MFTDSERRGARVIAIVLILGTLTDLWRARHPVYVDLPADRSTGTVRAPAAGEPSGPDTVAAAHRLLDLNSATVGELDALPGIGPVLAGRIVSRRREIGSFHSLDELLSVPGIGPRLLEKLRPLVRVSP